MKAPSGVRARATLSPLIGSLSGFGLIALPLHGSVTPGGYEDIHHSGLGGFKVFFLFFFPGEKGLKSIEVSRNIRLV